MKDEAELKKHLKFTDDVLNALYELQRAGPVPLKDIMQKAGIASGEVTRRIIDKLVHDRYVTRGIVPDTIEITYEGLNFRWYGGYTEQYKLGHLTESVSLSTLKTNRQQRKSLLITTGVAVLTLLVLGWQACIQTKQANIQERSLQKERPPSQIYQDSHDLYYLGNDSSTKK